MGRMYGRGKGMSKSSIPYKKKPPRWLNISNADVVREIEALAKKGKKINLNLRL
jgi:small subunit ribosomal protein S13e